MKRQILYIPVVIVICILLFYGLFFAKENSSNTGFKRSFGHFEVSIRGTYKFPDRSFTFLWAPDNNIWLLDYKNPFTLLKTDYDVNSVKTDKLTPPKDFDTTSRKIHFDRFGSSLFMNNERGDIAIMSNSKVANYKMSNLKFDALKATSPTSAIVREYAMNKDQYQTFLTKLSFLDKGLVNKKYLLPKQVDGFFCTDGAIYYDKAYSKYFYLYFYRGEFLCLDTNLNLLYKAKTIDTVRLANIKPGIFTSAAGAGKKVQKRTLTTPPNLVNKSISIDNNRVYVNSGLKADNEEKITLLKNEPIDVYAIEDGRYLSSFYLPRYNGYRMRNFEVKNDVVVAIYENYLITFNLKRVK